MYDKRILDNEMKREMKATKATYIVVDSGAKLLLLPSVHGLSDVAKSQSMSSIQH